MRLEMRRGLPQGTLGRRGRRAIHTGGESPFGERFQNALRSLFRPLSAGSASLREFPAASLRLRKGSSSNAVLPPSTGIYSRSGVLPVARLSCPELARFRFRTKAMIPIPAKASPPINGGSPQESSCTAILRFSAGPASASAPTLASAANPRISNETSTPITPTTSRIQLRTCTAFPPLGTLMVCSGWIQQREPARQP